MRLARLVYCSRATTEVGAVDAQSIAATSAPSNESAGITGVLTFDREVFLQALEGPRDAVNALYLRVARDPRHRDVTLVSYQEVRDRWFARWAMGYLGPLRPSREVLERLGVSELEPFELRGDAAGRLLRAVAEALDM